MYRPCFVVGCQFWAREGNIYFFVSQDRHTHTHTRGVYVGVGVCLCVCKMSADCSHTLTHLDTLTYTCQHTPTNLVFYLSLKLLICCHEFFGAVFSFRLVLIQSQLTSETKALLPHKNIWRIIGNTEKNCWYSNPRYCMLDIKKRARALMTTIIGLGPNFYCLPWLYYGHHRRV